MPRTYKPKQPDLPKQYEAGFLDKLDGRTELSKVLRGNRATVIDDLGGDSDLSHIQRAMVDRYVFLEAYISQLEVEIATNPKNKEGVISRWIQAVNAMTGLAKTLGITRRQTSNAWANHGPMAIDAASTPIDPHDTDTLDGEAA